MLRLAPPENAFGTFAGAFSIAHYADAQGRPRWQQPVDLLQTVLGLLRSEPPGDRLDLQSQLEGTENRIAVARKRYIDSVNDYNKMVRFFPTNLTARYILHLEVRPNFTATSPGVEKPPEVKF